MRKRLSILAALGIFIGLIAAPGKADTVTGGQLTAWNPNYLSGYPSYMPGLYYWNNNSGEGSQANIGWCMIGGPECGMNTTPGFLPYYSVSFTAPSTFFLTSSGNPARATLLASDTDQKGVGNPYDIYGYYLTDSSGTPIAGSATAMFTSNDPIGTNYALNFTAGQQYAFYIENVQGPNTDLQTTYWFGMNASANMASGSMPADPVQHFSVFGNSSTYYIGADDADACLSPFSAGASPCVPANQFDYNDMVVELTTATPEPAPFLLVSGGGLFLGLLLHRKRRA